MLWWKVLAMLHPWRILVPLKLLDGFNVALSSLEKLVAVAEQLPWRLMSTSGVWPNVVRWTIGTWELRWSSLILPGEVGVVCVIWVSLSA
jgi:hypothetical protein